jgi:3',5'-cyclic AMP phosphodiesterase CpdA
MKAIWLTDIHLEFLDHSAFSDFLKKLGEQDGDALLISGDIAQAPSVEDHLTNLAETLQIPVYFVLGNHDCYEGSIPEVRDRVGGFAKDSALLHWLSDCGPISLTPTTSLVGHDGWGDGRLGDYDHSTVSLSDFFLIRELTGLSPKERLGKLKDLGDEAAEHLRRVIPEALKSAEHVVVLTHVPPFREAAWYEGHPSNSQWLPFFSCKAVGDVLYTTMQSHPDKRMTVLCGHTHGGGRSKILPNLKTITGPARYGHPAIQEVFEWV